MLLAEQDVIGATSRQRAGAHGDGIGRSERPASSPLRPRRVDRDHVLRVLGAMRSNRDNVARARHQPADLDQMILRSVFLVASVTGARHSVEKDRWRAITVG
jgi:hypothetical protein